MTDFNPRTTPTTILPTDPLGDVRVDYLHEGLAEFPVHRPPSTLYRFFTARALSSLTEELLRLTPPIEFNDPFEVWAGLSTNSLTEEAVLRSVLAPSSLFGIALQANYPGYDLTGANFTEELTQAVKTTPHYYRVHLKSQVDAIANSCAQQMGVSCFSGFTTEEFQGELGIHHWAMYADSHAGFALSYDGAHPQMIGLGETKWLFPVEYVDQRETVELAYFNPWSDAKMWRTFRHWLALKARRAWEHEREWRLAFPIRAVPDRLFVQIQLPNGRTGYFLRLWEPGKPHAETAAHASVVSAAYLGTRVTSELKAQILAAVEAPHLRHVHVYQMEVDETRYALVPHLLRQGLPQV